MTRETCQGILSLEGFGQDDPFVRRIGDYTKARVAFDADEKVAGFFILPPETP